MIDTYFDDNLTLRKAENLHYMPYAGRDDQGQTIALSELVKQTGIDRTTLADKMKNNKKWLSNNEIYKDSNGRWIIRLRVAAALIEQYKYYRLNTKTGKNWTKEELRMIYCSDNNKIVAERLNRTPEAIKVKRSKLGIIAFRKQRKWKYPFFITPHAMLRYKRRILDISDQYIIYNINRAFNNIIETKNIELSNHSGCIYSCQANDKQLNFNCVVITEAHKEWPIVINILKYKDLK
jgi:hypothetical protein